MSYLRNRSGFFLQSAHGNRGNFELVVPKSHGVGFVHFWRNNDDGSLPWVGPNCFGTGKNSDVSVIQSRYGNPGHLELVTNEDGRLATYWREDNAPWNWNGPFYFFAGVRGGPALIQSTNGNAGNFEVVAASANGGLVHLWRDNDASGLPWRPPTFFGAGTVDGVALMQGNFGDPGRGHLELIANESGRLAHYFRDDGHSWAWSNPTYIADGLGVRGTPALIQSRHGSRGNFELVAAHRAGGLVHIWRNNDASGLPWQAPIRFGSGLVDAVSLIQSNFGLPGLGHLEVVARQSDGRLALYWREDQAPWSWNGPFFIGVERAWNMNECTFSWRPAFLQEDTRVTVRVQLNFDAGITPTTQQNLMSTWRIGILSKWDDVFDSVAPNGDRRAIRVDVQWVNSNPHQVVRVRSGVPSTQSNSGTWDTADTGNVAAHEFGHFLGLADEYTSAACPTRSPIDTSGVMGNSSQPALERHMRPIAGWYCGHTASYRRRWVLPKGIGVSMVSLYPDLAADAKVKFKDHIRMIADRRAGDRELQTKVGLTVSTGVPPDQFQRTLAIDPSGGVQLLAGNTAERLEESTGRMDRAIAQRVFAAALELLDMSSNTERRLNPDTPVITLFVTDGDTVGLVNLALTDDEREGATSPPPGFGQPGSKIALDSRVRTLIPLLEELVRASATTGK